MSGYIGYLKTPTTANGGGVWTPKNQSIYRNLKAWPIKDADWDSVSLLLHMDGANNSTTFTDVSKNSLSVTRSGNAIVSTGDSVFGGASAYFDGSGDYLIVQSSSLYSFGSGNFTIEGFFKRPSTTGRQDISGTYLNITTGWGVCTSVNNAGDIGFYVGNTLIAASSASSWSANQWVHFLVSRSGTTLKIFLNGNQVASVTNSTNITDGNSLVLGAAGSLAVPLLGYIDEFRITKGVARKTSSFSTPTEPYPDNR